jgi:UDP-N-acetylglucosamine diphosphorylase/glucosamine-1-phosphate N-acetyltransferase
LLSPKEVCLNVRSYLSGLVKEWKPQYFINEIPADVCTFVNGRIKIDEQFLSLIKDAKNEEIVFLNGDDVILARASGKNLDKIRLQLGTPFTKETFNHLPKAFTDTETIQYHWELVHQNGKEIEKDTEYIVKTFFSGKKLPEFRLYKGVHFINEERIYIDEGAVIKPGVVLDAEEGPIYIGRGVKVLPNSTIIGPAVVGDGSMIKVGAMIYENTTIGPVCKIGGEVEGSIIWGYSNKQHAGFLGHSYLGPWVNLGADTNNSDLKNNYSTVKIHINGEDVDTGSQFVGLTMGDHSKSGINTMFNTGTVVGICCNIYGSGYPKKYIPSFTWGGTDEDTTIFKLDQALKIAERVMNRRKLTLGEIEKDVIRTVFESTVNERKKYGVFE